MKGGQFEQAEEKKYRVSVSSGRILIDLKPRLSDEEIVHLLEEINITDSQCMGFLTEEKIDNLKKRLEEKKRFITTAFSV